MLKRFIPILVAVSLLLAGAAPAPSAAQDGGGFTVTDEMFAQIIAWLLENDPERFLELLAQQTADTEPEPEPTPEIEPERSPEETLSYWQQDGRTAYVDQRWACLVGSYHHTCTTWVNGSGDRQECSRAGCDPTG